MDAAMDEWERKRLAAVRKQAERRRLQDAKRRKAEAYVAPSSRCYYPWHWTGV